MIRVKITFSYDGSKFCGFQIQNKHKSVAGDITKALHKMNIQSTLVGSGRTDSGVHALNQVAHFDVPDYWSNSAKLHAKLNQLLAPHIFIKKVELVAPNFHARFSAKKRFYRYVLYDGEYKPFLSDFALHVEKFDVAKLDSIVKNFVGTHNFEFFRKSGSETKTDIREITKAGAYRYKHFVIIYFYGNSFLRSQVRMMCGVSLEIMQDKLTLQNLKEQLLREKKHSSSLVPPCGLYLSKIYY